MKSVSTFFAILALLLVVFLFIAVSIQLLIDPNKLKPIVISEMKKRTGYELTIDGNLTWSLYPLFTVKMNHVALADPNQKKPFLELSNVNLGTPLGKIIFSSFSTRDFSGFVEVKDLTLLNIHAQNASGRFLLSRTHLIVDPIYAAFYGGTLHAHIHGNNMFIQQQLPHWDGSIELNDFQLQPLLMDLKVHNAVDIVGYAKVKFNGESIGKTNTQLLQNLNGLLSFNISHGQLIGIDLNYLLQSAESLIKSEVVPASPSSPSTPFNNIQGTGVISQGTLILRNAFLSTATFTANVTGQIDLAKQNLNLRLQIIPNDTSKYPLKIPVIIQGTLSNPLISLDLSAIKNTVVKIGIDKIKEKAKDEIEKHAQDFIQKILNR